MSPSIASAGPAGVTVENEKAMKVIDDLFAKLSVSKEQDEINQTSMNIASFINGDIETADAPTK
jgi:elongation factor 3